jgi:hypothetical protein
MIPSSPVISVVLALIASLLGGGLVAAVLRYRVQVRGEDRTDFDSILQEVKDQRNEAWAKLDEQNKRLTHMEVEIQGLRLARDFDPFPMWIIDTLGNYIFANSKFEELFLEPRGQTYRDVIGQSHEYIFPKQFCDMLKNLDAAARSRPDGTARGSGTLDLPTLGRVQVTVHKFPIRVKPVGIIIAIAGYMTDIDPETRLIGDHPS